MPLSYLSAVILENEVGPDVDRYITETATINHKTLTPIKKACKTQSHIKVCYALVPSHLYNGDPRK